MRASPLPFHEASTRVFPADLDVTLIPFHLEVLVQRAQRGSDKRSRERRQLASFHKAWLSRAEGIWSDTLHAEERPGFLLELASSSPAAALEHAYAQPSAILYPGPESGFDAGRFLAELDVLLQDPCVTLDVGEQMVAMALLISALEHRAWVIESESRLGDEESFGLKVVTFVQSLDGTCLRITHVEGHF